MIAALFRVVKIDNLLQSKSHPLFCEALPGLLSYSERHFQRLDKLNQASHMIGYVASLIALLPVAEGEGVSGDNNAVKDGGRTALKQQQETERDVVVFRNTNNAKESSNSDGSGNKKRKLLSAQ